MTKVVNIDQRLVYNGNIGTVRYIGPLKNQQGIWLGIEWDEKERGKHNGSYEGIHYFDTKYLNSGSFLPLRMLGSKIVTGINCNDAFLSKYNLNNSYLSDKIKLDNKRYVENVGFERIQDYLKNYENLQLVDLSGKYISCLTEHESISNLNLNIHELNISHNLITKIHQIIHIIDNMDKLKELNISSNLIKFEETIDRTYPIINKLAANSMGLGWKELENLLQLFPCLQELSFAYNDVIHNTLTSTFMVCNFSHKLLNEKLQNVFPYNPLKKLDLQGNEGIRDWLNDVAPLAHLFPQLESLCLNNTNLCNISNNSESQATFPNLRNLSLYACKIGSWADIGTLGIVAPLIESLMISKNPIYPTNEEQVSFGKLGDQDMSIVANLPGLKVLNRTPITPLERKTSELFYVNYHGPTWIECTSKSESAGDIDLNRFYREHPTYASLVERYGPPESRSEPISPLIKNELVKITFVCQGMKVPKRIPNTLSVLKCKSMVRSIFKLNRLSNITLTLLPTDTSTVAIEMDNDYRELSFYSVKNDDEISVT